VTASTGNHAQSVAFAARLHDVPAVLFVPEGANPDKIASIERLGGTVRQVGERFDDARLAAEQYAAETGAFFVNSGNEPRLIAGVGTAALEVLETQQPETELVIVPVGGGSGLAGWLTVRDGLAHGAELWGVQSAQAPAVYESWRAHEAVERSNTTIAEGLATAVGFGLPLEVMWRSLDDFLLVDDSEIEAAVIALLEMQHILAEPAGVASLAAALGAAERVRGRRVVLVVSGSNITLPQLRALLARESG
jgi:threonine dehydratase